MVSVVDGAQYNKDSNTFLFKGLKIDNPHLLPSRPYGVFADASLLESTEGLEKFRKELISDMIDGTLALYKCVLCEYLKGIKSVHKIRNFDPIKVLPQMKEDALLTFGEETFGWMARNIPNVMFLRSFTHILYIQNTPAALSDSLQFRDPMFKYYDMRDYMPEGNPDDWFYVPWMGEKLSEKGMKAYAEAVGKVIKSRLPALAD